MAGRAGSDQPLEPSRFAGEKAAVGFVEAEVGARRQGAGLEQEGDQVLGRAFGRVEGADDAGQPRDRVAGAGGASRQATRSPCRPAGSRVR